MRSILGFVLALQLLLTPSLCLAGPLMAPTGDSAAAVQLTQIRWSTHTDAVTGDSSLRLVFDVSGAVQADGAVMDTPSPRLMVNIRGAAPGNLTMPILLDGKIAGRVSVNSDDGQNSKVVVDLTRMIDGDSFKVFTLPGNQAVGKPFRVVIDINRPVPPPVYNFTPGLRGKVVVIDPGHGGSDCGAVGPDNIQEKSITLSVGLKVKSLLEQAGAKVYMTRMTDKDVFAPNDNADDELGARVAVGNKNKADVFLDIHANYFGSPQVRGTGTYYYQKSAYDRLLAQCIQSSVISVDGLNDRGIVPANFFVLKNTQMPAMLIEVGFLSNPDEERLLNTSQFQQTLAQGIVNGLDAFFAQAGKQGGSN